jgi:hypothetical protein
MVGRHEWQGILIFYSASKFNVALANTITFQACYAEILPPSQKFKHRL